VKRVLSACLEQTFKFETEEESKIYIDRLSRKDVKCKVVDRRVEPDKTVTVKIIRDYNGHPLGDYMN
jgi:hypothetical protein